MRLQFKSPYLSIDQFDPIEIPEFVVLTGVNGSGKSHLMEAIDKRHVVIEDVNNPHIVLFNYETFKLDQESTFNVHQLSSEQESAWQYYQQHIKNQAQQCRASLGDIYEELKALCKSENKSFWSLENNEVRKYKEQFINFYYRQNIKKNPQVHAIYSIVKKISYSIDEIEHDDFVRLYKPFELINDFLPHQLGKVFWDYYVKYLNNLLNKVQNDEYNKNYKVLGEDEFVSTHGKKPWDSVNGILKTFDTLKYKVNSPEGLDYFGNFQLKLKHIEKENLEIEFSSLSSGEKVMMALVASVYKSSADKHFPDLLLLDEVDASLHPSMMKNMLEVIDRIFLKQGVKVILVSHSPTTIALAPDQSIYVMNRSGKNRIEKKSKQEALSILTQGYATIEQGLKLFDEVAKSKLTVITEGYNSRLIITALKLYGVTGVEVLSGVEEISGKNQLKTLFQFFAKVPLENKVIFVWDCDSPHGEKPSNNTYPFSIARNEKNTIATKGIENAFPEKLFDGFTKTITLSKGAVKKEFDESRKRDFESFVINRSNKGDFSHFSALITEIERISRL